MEWVDYMFDIAVNDKFLLQDSEGVQLTPDEIYDACILKPLYSFRRFFEVCMDYSTCREGQMEELMNCMNSCGDRMVIPPFVRSMLFDFEGIIGFGMITSGNTDMMLDDMDCSLQFGLCDHYILDARNVKYSKGRFVLQFNIEFYLDIDLYVDENSKMTVCYYTNDAVFVVRIVYTGSYEKVLDSVKLQENIFLETDNDNDMKCAAEMHGCVAVRNRTGMKLIDFARRVSSMNENASYLLMNDMDILDIKDITDTLYYMSEWGMAKRLGLVFTGDGMSGLLNSVFLSVCDEWKVSDNVGMSSYTVIDITVNTQSDYVYEMPDLYDACCHGSVVYMGKGLAVEAGFIGEPEYNSTGYVLNMRFYYEVI